MATKSRRYDDQKESESRYMKNDKKRYYLASVDENVQVLLDRQKDELTKMLIESKSEYDRLIKESSEKTRETEELDKKIIMLEKMSKKTKKKHEEAVSDNDTMKTVIELKRKKKQEEQYQKKTLQKQIESYKTDILLIQKDIYTEENEAKKLDKQYQKERFIENDIKERKNQVYSKISDQNKKNKFDKNEQNLQLQYYQTIIDQKYAFIQSADERKERQAKIAQEAKNDSQDKQEVEKRHQLELTLLYNQYLREKMAEQLEDNEKLEETFTKIRDICGTQDLKEIVDRILTKDKRYNYCAALVAQKEEEKAQLKEEISRLQKEFIELKTEILVKEETEEHSKSVSTIQTSFVEETEAELTKKEKELQRELVLLQEKHKDILLVYTNVFENINNLAEYQKENFSDIEEEKKEEQQPKLSLDEEEKKNQEETKPEEEKKEEEKKEEAPAQEEEKKEEPKQEEEKKEEEKKEEEKKEEEKKEEAPAQEEEKKEETKQEEVPAQEEAKNQEAEKKERENNQTIPNNMLTNAETEQQQTITITETREEQDLIETYKHFLDQALKRFKVLFLCHAKQEFINLMREKGIEAEKQRPTEEVKRPTVRRATRKRTTRRRPTNGSMRSKTDANQSQPPIGDEEPDNDNAYYDKDIIERFITEQNKNRVDFINNTKDKRTVKK